MVARQQAPASYADAVDISAPSVANIYTKRLVEYSPSADERPGFGSKPASAQRWSSIRQATWSRITTSSDAAEISVQFSDGRIAEPEIVGVDAETDLALLKVDMGDCRRSARQFAPAAYRRCRPGHRQPLRPDTIGDPGHCQRDRAAESDLDTFENFIQTDAAINAGNSGGALINVAAS